jgi:phosphate transport system permease protein
MSTQLDQSSPAPGYPEAEALNSYLARRNRRNVIWHLVFQLSTVVGIIALVALLYNIMNGAFGYVALQNKVDPETLVLAADEALILEAPNTISSEDDQELVKGVEANPNGIAFFGYAYYQQDADKLKVLSVEGIPPTAESAEKGEYPLARPLYIYTTAEALKGKAEISAFINYYLTHVNDVIEEVGYFPISAEALTEQKQGWLAANDLPVDASDLPPVEPAKLPADGAITITGSSTVYPLSRALAVQFRREGYPGGVKIDSTGTTAGFQSFCAGETDILNASRPMNRTEIEACSKKQVQPIEFRIGTDALVLVTSQENNFLENVTLDQIRQIFTSTKNWPEVNAEWPNEPIHRFIPGLDSGTLDFFAETVFARGLKELPSETLIAILKDNLSSGLLRRFESEKPLAERTPEELYELVRERVIESRVVNSWSLVDSLFNRDEIVAAVQEIPNGELEFRSWISPRFLLNPQSSTADLAGVRTAVLGSLWIILITILVAFPIGVGAAIYLEEYAANVSSPLLRRLNGLIQTNINNLAGVPSIIYGMLGLAIFVRGLEVLTSGTLFGLSDPTTANGRTVLSAGLTMALLTLPLLIINGQEAIRAVPNSLRQAGMGLGATKWQTIWAHVLPNALPGILTGTILSISRAIGETAPLIVIGASTFIVTDPSSPFSKFTALPIQIYQWTARPQPEFRNIAAAAIIVLLILLLSLNASAIILRNHFSKRRLA